MRLRGCAAARLRGCAAARLRGCAAARRRGGAAARACVGPGFWRTIASWDNLEDNPVLPVTATGLPSIWI
jgi:hypothetical protein